MLHKMIRIQRLTKSRGREDDAKGPAPEFGAVYLGNDGLHAWHD